MYTELVIDAIFGTGFKGRAQGMAAKTIDLINEADKTVIAVDLPSGLEADTGKVRGSCIRARVTVTLALPKLGLFLEPGARFVGRIVTADISLPREAVLKKQFKRDLLDEAFCRSIFPPPREEDSHKGTYGHVVLAGGSPGMTGALFLAAQAALRSGAGLVTAGVPKSLNGIMEEKLTEAMSLPLPETGEGTLSLFALESLKKILPGKVLVLGPGLSRHAECQNFVQSLVRDLPCPAVFDADGLFPLPECIPYLKNRKYPLILTPHPGEMAHLLEKSVEDIQEDRVGAVTEAAQKYHSVVVLKGAKTLIATPEGQLYVNTTGNPGMATGGSGDVLAGMIGAFLARKMKGGEAAALAVYLHGLAGDRGALAQSQTALAAGDILAFLPSVFLAFESR